MRNHGLVHSEHLDHYGYLFGDIPMKQVDAISSIAASLGFDVRACTVGKTSVQHEGHAGGNGHKGTLPGCCQFSPAAWGTEKP